MWRFAAAVLLGGLILAVALSAVSRLSDSRRIPVDPPTPPPDRQSPVKVHAGEPAELPKGADSIVEGLVLSHAAGKGLGQVSVSCGSGDAEVRVQTNALGEYRLPRNLICEGRTLRAHARGYKRAERRIHREEPTPSNRMFPIFLRELWGEVEVAVVDSDGRPVAGAHVLLAGRQTPRVSGATGSLGTIRSRRARASFPTGPGARTTRPSPRC